MNSRRSAVEAIRYEAERYIQLRIGDTSLEEVQELLKIGEELKRTKKLNRTPQQVLQDSVHQVGIFWNSVLPLAEAHKIIYLLEIYQAAGNYLDDDKDEKTKYLNLQTIINTAIEDLMFVDKNNNKKNFVEKYNSPQEYVETLLAISELGGFVPEGLASYQGNESTKIIKESALKKAQEPFSLEKIIQLQRETDQFYAQLWNKNTSSNPGTQELIDSLPILAKALKKMLDQLERANNFQAEHGDVGKISDIAVAIEQNKDSLEKMLQRVIKPLLSSKDAHLPNIVYPLTSVLGVEIASSLLNAPSVPKTKSIISLYLLQSHLQEELSPNEKHLEKIIEKYAVLESANFAELYTIFKNLPQHNEEEKEEKEEKLDKRRAIMAAPLLKCPPMVNWLLDNTHQEEYASIIQELEKNFEKHTIYSLKKLFKNWTKENFEAALQKDPPSQAILYGMVLNSATVSAADIKKLDITYIPAKEIQSLNKATRIAYLQNLNDWKALGSEEATVQDRINRLIQDFSEEDMALLVNSKLGLIAAFNKHPEAAMKLIKEHAIKSVLDHPQILYRLSTTSDLFARKNYLENYLQEAGKRGISAHGLLSTIKQFQQAEDNTVEKRASEALLQAFPDFLMHTQKFEPHDMPALLEIYNLYRDKYFIRDYKNDPVIHALQAQKDNPLLGVICFQNKILLQGFLTQYWETPETIYKALRHQTRPQQLSALHVIAECLSETNKKFKSSIITTAGLERAKMSSAEKSKASVQVFGRELAEKAAAQASNNRVDVSSAEREDFIAMIQIITNDFLERKDEELKDTLDAPIDQLIETIGLETAIKICTGYDSLLEQRNEPDLLASGRHLFADRLLKYHFKEQEPLNNLLIAYLVNTYAKCAINELPAVFKFLKDNAKDEQNSPEKCSQYQQRCDLIALNCLKNQSMVAWLLNIDNSSQYNLIFDHINLLISTRPQEINLKDLFANWTRENFNQVSAKESLYPWMNCALLSNPNIVSTLTEEEINNNIIKLDITLLSKSQITLLDKGIRIAYLKHLDTWKKAKETLGENEENFRIYIDSLVYDFSEADIKQLSTSECGLIAAFKKHPKTVINHITTNQQKSIGLELLEVLDKDFLRAEKDPDLHKLLGSRWQANWINNLWHPLIKGNFYEARPEDKLVENQVVLHDLKANLGEFAHKAQRPAREFVLTHYPEIINLLSQEQSGLKQCLIIYLEKAGEQGISAQLLLEAIEEFQQSNEGTQERQAANALLAAFPAFLARTQKFEPQDRVALLEIYQLYRANHPVQDYENDPIICALRHKKDNRLIEVICFQDPLLLKGYFVQHRQDLKIINQALELQDPHQRLGALAILAKCLSRENEIFKNSILSPAGRGRAQMSAEEKLADDLLVASRPVAEKRSAQHLNKKVDKHSTDRENYIAAIHHITNSFFEEEFKENTLEGPIDQLIQLLGIETARTICTGYDSLIDQRKEIPLSEKGRHFFADRLLKYHFAENEPLHNPLVEDVVNTYADCAINELPLVFKFLNDKVKNEGDSKEAQQRCNSVALAFLKNKLMIKWLLNENNADQYDLIFHHINSLLNSPQSQEIDLKNLFASWELEDFKKIFAKGEIFPWIMGGLLSNSAIVDKLKEDELNEYVRSLDLKLLSTDQIKSLDKRVRIAYLKHIDKLEKASQMWGQDEKRLRTYVDNLTHDFSEKDVEQLIETEFGLIATFKKHPRVVTNLITKHDKKFIGLQLLEALDKGFLRTENEPALHVTLKNKLEARWVSDLLHQLVMKSFYQANDAYTLVKNDLVLQDLKLNPYEFTDDASSQAREFVLLHYPEIIHSISSQDNLLNKYMKQAGRNGVNASAFYRALQKFQAYNEGTLEKTAAEALLIEIPVFLEHTKKFSLEDSIALSKLYQLYRAQYPLREENSHIDPMIKALNNLQAGEADMQKTEFLARIYFQDANLLAGYVARNKDKKPRESLIVTYLRTFLYGATVGFAVTVGAYFIKQVKTFLPSLPDLHISLFRQEAANFSKILDVIKILAVGTTTVIVGAGLGSAALALGLLIAAGAATAGVAAVVGRAMGSKAAGAIKTWWPTAKVKAFFGYDPTPAPQKDHNFIRAGLSSLQTEEEIKKFREMMFDPINEEMRMRFAQTLIYIADNDLDISKGEPSLNPQVLTLALSIREGYKFHTDPSLAGRIVNFIGDIPQTILWFICLPFKLAGLTLFEPSWLTYLRYKDIEKTTWREVQAQKESASLPDQEEKEEKEEKHEKEKVHTVKSSTTLALKATTNDSSQNIPPAFGENVAQNDRHFGPPYETTRPATAQGTTFSPGDRPKPRKKSH